MQERNANEQQPQKRRGPRKMSAFVFNVQLSFYQLAICCLRLMTLAQLIDTKHLRKTLLTNRAMSKLSTCKSENPIV